jgi:hypothetical protein
MDDVLTSGQEEESRRNDSHEQQVKVDSWIAMPADCGTGATDHTSMRTISRPIRPHRAHYYTRVNK